MKEIQLTQGRIALIDDEDYDLVRRYSWCGVISGRNFYAQAACPINGQVKMHRLIMGCSKDDGKIVDHIDHNTLNNQKANLRVCTQRQNVYNSTNPNKSGFRGVQLLPSGRYRAQIKNIEGKFIQLGVYDNPEDAARAYDIKAIELQGEFATTNFSKDIYKCSSQA
jgi:hypothetical protein